MRETNTMPLSSAIYFLEKFKASFKAGTEIDDALTVAIDAMKEKQSRAVASRPGGNQQLKKS